MEEDQVDRGKSPPEDPMLVSYRELRRAIGMIGIALPIVLIVGGNVFGEAGIRDSISSYYYSPTMGAVMVGSLCSIGVFLWSYIGDHRWDSLAGNIACAAAVGVAVFPCSNPNGDATPTRHLHFISAAVLFLLLAYFCFFSFRDQDPGTRATAKKPLRNGIYFGCGIVIVLMIASIGGLHLLYDGNPPGTSVFWLESIAIWAFGWSWYVKGKGLGVVQG